MKTKNQFQTRVEDVEVPQVVRRMVPKIETQEIVRQVPRIEVQTVEKIVEVPQVPSVSLYIYILYYTF